MHTIWVQVSCGGGLLSPVSYMCVSCVGVLPAELSVMSCDPDHPPERGQILSLYCTEYDLIE